MARRSYKGSSVATSLLSTAAASDTTLACTDASTFPPGVAPFVVTLDYGLASEEKCLVGARSGNNLSSVTRGWDGTVATAHNAGALIRHTISAVDLDDANNHVNLPVDTAPTNIHHTIGTTANQAAAGNHVHPAPAPAGIQGYSYTCVPGGSPAANNVTLGSGGGYNAPSATSYFASLVSGSTAGNVASIDLFQVSATGMHLSGYEFGLVWQPGLAAGGGGAPSSSFSITNPNGTDSMSFVVDGFTGAVTLVTVNNNVTSSTTATGGPIVYSDTANFFKIMWPEAGGNGIYYINNVVQGTANVRAWASLPAFVGKSLLPRMSVTAPGATYSVTAKLFAYSVVEV